MLLQKKGFSFCFYLSDGRLKRFSVSRCPRDDLGRLRFPDDVSQAIRTERRGTDISRWRDSRTSRPNLRRCDECQERHQGSSLIEKVSVFIMIIR